MTKFFCKIGNSRIIFWDGKKRYIEFPTTTFRPSDFLSRTKITELYFFSVVPSLSQKLLLGAKKKRIPALELKASDLDIQPAYKENLGVDRLMNVYAASKLTKKNIVVVDIGTALTVDFYRQKNKKHLGGWISAGPQLTARVLADFTAKLPYVAPRKINKQLGTNTIESLLIGQREFLHGMILVARQVAAQLFGQEFRVFVTGGGADLVSEDRANCVSDLGLKGLKDYWETKCLSCNSKT